MATTEQPQKSVGTRQIRKEDPELITGGGRYVDDISVPGMLWVHVVRSPFAHARINGIDTSKAEAAPGVVAAYTGKTLELGPLVMAWPINDECKAPPHQPLTMDKARYVGDPVAVVVAETRAQAKDAAELVDVDWEPLPAVTDIKAALADDAPVLYEDLGSNDAGSWIFERDSPAPRRAATGPYFEDPDLVKIKEEYYLGRLIPNAMEPRGVVVDVNPSMGEYTVYSATQIPHILRTTLTITCGVPEAKLRVVAPDVGGGFGSKLEAYPEDAICLGIAKELRRPVKWIEERSEGYVATLHGREMYQQIELAATKDGILKAVRVKLWASMGAYMRIITPGIPMLGAWLYAGRLRPRGVRLRVHERVHQQHVHRRLPRRRPARGHLRHRAGNGRPRPGAQHGPGRAAAQELHQGVELPQLHDRVGSHGRLGQLQRYAGQAAGEPRLRGLPGRAEGPPRERLHEAAGRRVLDLARDVRHRALAVLAALKYIAGGWDAATVEFLPTGTVRVLTGVSPHGQGEVTTFSQIVADQLGVDFDDVEVLHGDTQVVPLGLDTYGSRGLAVGGVALYKAGEKILAKARTLAAHELEVSGGRPGVRRRQLHGQGHRPLGQHQGARVHRLDARTTCPTAWSRASRPPTSTTRPTSRGRTARTPAWSRSTPRPGPSTCSATSPWTTAACRSTRWWSRGRCTAASRRASPRRSSRRPPTTRRATSGRAR